MKSAAIAGGRPLLQERVGGEIALRNDCSWVSCLASPGAYFTSIFQAQAEPFYKGKTVRIVVDFSASWGFESYSRVISRHIGRHIPGNPTVIVENMPGNVDGVTGTHAGVNRTRPGQEIDKPCSLKNLSLEPFQVEQKTA